MKITSKLALAAVLSAGIAAPALVTPAVAAKKDEKPSAKFSAEFLKTAKPAQDAIGLKDYATAEPQVVAAEAIAKTDDEKYTVAALRYDLEQGKLAATRARDPNAPIDETRLVAPMQVLLASPNTPADAKARFAYRLGALNYYGRQYPAAIRYLEQAQQLGYPDPENNLPLLIVKSRIDGGDVRGGLTQLDAVIGRSTGAGGKAPEDYYRYGISKANGAKLKPETLSWLVRYAQAYPTQKNWRDVIVMYGLQPGSVSTLDKDQRVDLYRLMRATNSLGDEAFYADYAQTVRDRGLPAETAAVLQEGMAKGKVPSTATYKQALATAQTSARAEGSYAPLEAKAKAAADGRSAAQTGDGYLSQGNWAKAAEMYKLALGKGGVSSDDVSTHLGIALARSGDKAGAQAAFAQVKGQPRNEIAMLWTAYLNQSAA